MGSAILVAGVVALAGCGGDDGNGNGGGLSQEELDEQSAAICRDGREELQNLSTPDFSDAEQAEAFLTDAVAIADRALRELQALEPEEDLREEYDAYLALVEENRDDLEAILDKAKARDPSGQQDLAAYVNDKQRQRENKAAAREAGLTGCANT